MRAVFAGLVTFGGLLVCVSVVFRYFPDGFGPPWLMGILFAFVLFALAGVSLFLFNMGWLGRSPPGKSIEEQVAELESQGLLTSETFQATRCFQVEEFEDEGWHYFIDLVTGGVLYLNGQYHCDYEPIPEAEPSQPRKFPCSQFTLRRHKTAGYLVDLACAGDVLEPECLAPAFDEKDANQGLIPESRRMDKSLRIEITSSCNVNASTPMQSAEDFIRDYPASASAVGTGIGQPAFIEVVGAVWARAG